MISISKMMPDFFTVMTPHGVVHADGVRQIVKLIENELDINIYDRSFENALDEIEDKIEKLEEEIEPLKSKLIMLQTKGAMTNHDATRSSG
jgi:predicted  nucleic acid-binding Zn-ribbon protein